MANDDAELRAYIRRIMHEEAAQLSGGGVEGGVRGGTPDLGEFSKFINAAKGMKEAMTSDVDKALGGAVASKVVDVIVPNMQQPARVSNGIWDSNAAVAFASKMADQVTPLVDTVFARLGQERAGKLVDGLERKFLSKDNSQDDVLRALDPDNPAHIHYYMSLRNMSGIDAATARKSLIIEQERISATGYSGGSTGVMGGTTVETAGGGNGGVGSAGLETFVREQNEFMKKIIEKQQATDKALLYVVDKLEKLEKFPAQHRNSSSTPATPTVDIDDIEDRKDDGLGSPKVDTTPELTIDQVVDKEAIDKVTDSFDNDVVIDTKKKGINNTVVFE